MNERKFIEWNFNRTVCTDTQSKRKKAGELCDQGLVCGFLNSLTI